MIAPLLILTVRSFLAIGWFNPEANAQARDETRASIEKSQDEQPVQIRVIPQMTVAYLERNEPYWRLGGTIAEALDLMRRDGLDAPLYVRYPHSHRGKHYAQVGFRVNENPNREEPFLISEWPQQTVAVLELGPTTGTSAHQISRLENWSLKNGYQSLNTVTEVYEVAGSTAEVRMVEMWLAVVRHQPPPLGRSVETAEENAIPPSVEKAVENVPAPNDAQTDENSRVPIVELNGETAVTQNIPSKGQHDALDGVESTGGPNDDGTNVNEIKELVAAGEYEKVVELLIPNPCEDVPLAVWLGDLAVRLRAAARGVNQVSGKSNDCMNKLAEAFSARYSRYCGSSVIGGVTAKELSQTPESDPRSLGSARATLLYEFDRLLVRLGARSLPPTAAQTEVIELLARAYPLTGIR